MRGWLFGVILTLVLLGSAACTAIVSPDPRRLGGTDAAGVHDAGPPSPDAGACGRAGACTPGERRRSGTGCPEGATRDELCSAACVFEPQGTCAADACATPGVSERVRCGQCGTQERFCTAARVWEYGRCEGEGPCMPGTTGTTTCGRCGTQSARCTLECRWEGTGACSGEGECSLGETRRSERGCSGGLTRVETCNTMCVFEGSGPCTPRALDVMLLLDVTGSHGARVSESIATIESDFVTPLLSIGDGASGAVAVGVAYYADFPVSPYGNEGDRPFEGGLEPSSSAATIAAELAGLPRMNGGDLEEAGVEALSILTGGAPPASASPLTCSPGRIGGGCWRAGARRVIVLYTDAPSHNGPDPASAELLAPYMGTVGPNARWAEVMSRLRADAVELIVLYVPGSSMALTGQISEMLTDVGMPATNAIDATAIAPALRSAVARIRTVSGL